MSQKSITEKGRKISFLLLLTLAVFCAVHDAQANCKDPALRQKVSQTAKAKGVDENELLSIIAHESGCRYFAVAWNEPKKPETAKSKFFNSAEEAKVFAQNLIDTKSYRVDIGIGQINNEAHIQPKGWSLEEVLDPETALVRVVQVLKERGWAHYHSSNSLLAKKWQGKALAALNQILENSKSIKKPPTRIEYPKSSLIVFNVLSPEVFDKKIQTSWVIYNEL